jgi:hypothetical protein
MRKLEMDMTSKELYKLLDDAGWSFQSSVKNMGISWYAFRRLIGAKNCASSGVPPLIVIQPYEIELNNHIIHRTSQFEVKGMLPNGHWVDFVVYGIRFEDVISKADELTQILKTAWDAVA